jgi:glucokinase
MAKTGAKLIADIGGTNARFALARDGRVEGLRVLRTGDYPTVQVAARAFLAGVPDAGEVRRGAFDIAGPVVGGHARLTNNAWSFKVAEVRAELGMDDLQVLNDFAAAALGIPQLQPSDSIQIGGGQREEHGPIGVIGPGTGLGVGGLVHSERGWVVIPGEGGHATMPAATADEGRLLDILRERFGHVSAERVLSGQGIENLYEAVRVAAGRPGRRLAASEVTKGALDGSDPDCGRALDLFCAMLGTVAGNLALTLGASGGVFLIGGILPRFTARFAASGFRARFEAKGRLADFLRPIPTFLVTHDNPALLGLAAML